MRFSVIAMVAALAAVPAAAAPQDVNAETFYVAARELMGKGVAAMFDKRVKPMAAQLGAAAKAVKVQNDAATAKGAPLYCVPASQKGKGMGAQDAIARIGRVPQAQRRSSTLEQAWRAVMVRDYPCR